MREEKWELDGNMLLNLGYPEGPAIGEALRIYKEKLQDDSPTDIFLQLNEVLENPSDFIEDKHYAGLALILLDRKRKVKHDREKKGRDEPIDYDIIGEEFIPENAIEQMDQAMRLPIIEKAALMPDAHYGYGVPIGAVLATEDAIIPYAVGNDIGCRMCMSIYDIPVSDLDENRSSYEEHLRKHTRFNRETHRRPSEDEVLEREEFYEIPYLRKLKNKAREQLGTSGGGNHFVEFGIVELSQMDEEIGLTTGKYLALLSHSGSRGLGASIAAHYTDIAKEKRNLIKSLKPLSWLEIESEEGQEYWRAMNLAGDYASACHHDIHNRISGAMGGEILHRIENHHNFAWKEEVEGKQMYVHRKGATPAAEGEYGIIPGTMNNNGFIVKGKGDHKSLRSASHGAGRMMSRTQAKKTLSSGRWKSELKEAGVSLIGADLDESPYAYKDINNVIGAQNNQVDIIGRFSPRIVRMA